ncbi:MAG: AAA family ATPase [Proteobacteria bacterium]|nr:AAA family ATPase [Pseudomonadota bacterium]
MIQTLTITDFRNHTFSRIRTDGAPNIIITGPNGGGKTSILEAISVLSGNGGLRGATADEMARIVGARRDAPRAAREPPLQNFAVVAELSDGTEISVYWNAADNKKKAKLNTNASPLSKLGEVMRMVWITPREDRVFIDSASDRRAFFDRLCSGFVPNHSGHVFRLSKLLSERAFALKNRAADGWLTPIERQIAEIAIPVARARVNFVENINRLLMDDGRGMTDDGKSPSSIVHHPSSIFVSGMVEGKMFGGATDADLISEYAAYLSKNRELVADKMSIDGPHRADFGLFDGVLNRNADQLSTGQQKAALLRLIIAYVKAARSTSDRPILVLLDEIAAHLDAGARATLFSELQSARAQVWMTGLDRAAFSDLGHAKFIYCENGMITGNM